MVFEKLSKMISDHKVTNGAAPARIYVSVDDTNDALREAPTHHKGDLAKKIAVAGIEVVPDVEGIPVTWNAPETKVVERETKNCDECKSTYFADSSAMSGLCPECAHRLYGYAPCVHSMQVASSGERRCLRCGWDGSTSDYLRSLDREP